MNKTRILKLKHDNKTHARNIFFRKLHHNLGFSLVKGSITLTAKSGPYGLRSPHSMARARHSEMVRKHSTTVYGKPAATLAV